MVLYLLLRRPRAIIATNPPIFPGFIAYLYSRLTGAPVVLDSHPSSFGFDAQSKVATLTMPLQDYLIPRVEGSIVTEEKLVEKVTELGGRADIVHEAQPRWTISPVSSLPERPKVLLVGIFAPDEPVHLVTEAAWELPGVDFLITGDLRKCPEELLAKPAPNVHFVGFLNQKAYLEALSSANIVVTLTERPEDVSRAGCEAVSARRPLMISDWPAARLYFPHAIAVQNTVEGIVAGVTGALEEYDRFVEVADLAFDEQEKRWQSQLAVLRELTMSS
jgi:hypothetical protein